MEKVLESVLNELRKRQRECLRAKKSWCQVEELKRLESELRIVFARWADFKKY